MDDPSEDDRTRVKTRWLASVAAVAGVSSLTEAARAAGGIGWGMKSVGAALALIAGAVGIYVALPKDDHTPEARRAAEAPAWVGTTHERFEKTSLAGKPPTEPDPRPVISQPVDHRPSIIAQPVVAIPVVAEPVALPAPSAPEIAPDVDAAKLETAKLEAAKAEAAVEPAKVEARAEKVASRRVKVARASTARSPGKTPPAAAEPTPAPAAQPSGQLGEELALLSQVRSAVQVGEPGRALELLSGYEARFGKPILEMEADALRVDALCRSGQRDAARASAEAFQNEWPNSPLGRRVAAACP